MRSLSSERLVYTLTFIFVKLLLRCIVNVYRLYVACSSLIDCVFEEQRFGI